MIKLLLLFPLFLSHLCWGQQNLFNIPSGQMTPKDDFFYQHQLNVFSKNSIASKQHFAMGLTDQFEMGVNFLNFYPLGRDNKDKDSLLGPHDNIIALALQKSFTLHDDWSLNLGTQAGYTHIGVRRASYPSAFTYALASYYKKDLHLRLTGGSWISGHRFNGPGSTTGLLAGFEWMIQEGWYVMGDWISGNTKNSVSVLGGMVDLTKGVQLCLGYLIPNPKSAEGHGLVVELNLFTF